MTGTFDYEMKSRPDESGYPIRMNYNSNNGLVTFYASRELSFKFGLLVEQLDELIVTLLYIKKLGETNEQTSPQ